MNITLSLVALRDIFTNYASSAALNAARAFEARQVYATLDADIPSRIVPAALGREISLLDPTEQVFHVQIKRVPAGFTWLGEDETSADRWSAAEYAVVHAIADWKASAELKSQVVAARRHVELFNASAIAEEARRERMIKLICKRIPIPDATVRAVFALCADETTLREMVAQWEKALHTTIYELPAPSPQGNQSLPEDEEGASQGNGQGAGDRAQAGCPSGSLDGEAHNGQDRRNETAEVTGGGAGHPDEQAGPALPAARTGADERDCSGQPV